MERRVRGGPHPYVAAGENERSGIAKPPATASVRLSGGDRPATVCLSGGGAAKWRGGAIQEVVGSRRCHSAPFGRRPLPQCTFQAANGRAAGHRRGVGPPRRLLRDNRRLVVPFRRHAVSLCPSGGKRCQRCAGRRVSRPLRPVTWQIGLCWTSSDPTFRRRRSRARGGGEAFVVRAAGAQPGTTKTRPPPSSFWRGAAPAERGAGGGLFCGVGVVALRRLHVGPP